MNKEAAKKMYERISRYWDKRAENYAEMKIAQLNSQEFSLWETELKENLPSGRKLSILDVGTASGFLAIIAASLGHAVMGIDISREMIHQAKKLASTYPFHDRLSFAVENIENLLYENESFDVVISQNTFWTCVDVSKAYFEVYRLLKPGGIFLCYDLDFGSAVSVHDWQEPEYQKLMQECDAYKALLPISHVSRPDWDINALRNAGFIHCECRRNLSSKLGPHGSKREFSSAIFAIYAVKPDSIQSLPSSKDFMPFHRHNQLFYRESRLFGDKQDTEFLVLELIIQQPEGIRSSDIMEYFYIPKQTLTRMIANLTNKGMVIQKKNPRDSRSILLFSTRKGYEYYRDQTMKRLESYSSILQRMPSEKLILMNELYSEFLNAMIEQAEGQE